MDTPSQAAQLAQFIARYSPEIARTFKLARRKMRAFVPRGYELVYDNYNALGIGYGPSPNSSHVVVSIVQALAPHERELEGCPRVKTIIKSAASKRRPRRP